jgi:DNA phosphorothioation-dependent restriction protein DptG
LKIQDFQKILKMHPQKEIEDKFVSFLFEIGVTKGLGELPSKLFAILYMEPDTMTMEELAEKTGYSLASVSNALKLIELSGHLKKITKPGSKKIYFYMDKDLIAQAKEAIDKLYQNRICTAKDTLPGLIEQYSYLSRKNKESKKKLEIYKLFYSQILRYDKLLKLIHEKFDEI